PEALLDGGPHEADELVWIVTHEEMTPPVALLAYATGDVSRAAFWPMAIFSPEWCALRYGVEAGIPVRFCDLPATYGLSLKSTVEGRPDDPLGELAAAAGYDDPERWWED